MENKPTFGQALRAGVIVGLIGAGLNNIWSIVAQQMGSVAPPGFFVAVTLSSIFPTLIGAVLYFLLTRFTSRGKTIFIVVGALFTLVSFYPTFTTTQLPDGTQVGEGFTLLTLPMHIISGALAIWGIPKFAR